MSKNTGGPAFPHDKKIDHLTGLPISGHGMTLRDYFAAKALPGLIVPFLQRDLDTQDPTGWMDGLAGDAYAMADAMLKAREL